MTLQEITNQHPTPWRHMIQPGGNIVVIDGKNQMVQLMTMIEFVMMTTQQMSAAPAPSPACHYNQSVNTD